MRFPLFFLILGILGTCLLAKGDTLIGQEGTEEPAHTEERVPIEEPISRQAPGEVIQVASVGATPPLAETGLISLDFKEADIQTVLQALAYKARINIVTGKDVTGLVTIRLENVTWEQALDTIVKTHGYGYEKDENVILVTTLEELKTRREALKELEDIEPVNTKVIQLKFLDAADVKTFLEPQLTAQGKISVLEITGQKGWTFGAGEAGGGGGGGQEERERKERERARSKAIVITDTPTTIDRLEKILAKIDVMPKQILIESRVMEVSRDLLRDLGLDIGTGSAGAQTATALPTAIPAAVQVASSGAKTTVAEVGTQILGTAVAPSIFGPRSSIGSAGTAINMGLEFIFRKLNEPQFELIVRALEEDIRTNTLSAPHILTLSGQEAKILVGTKYPILETQVSGTATTTTTTTLSYYQDIGIELFVVPQVGGDKHIDMIIHPVVSSRTGTVGTNAYPILDIREAETQVILEHGETIVIGGLLKDVKAKSRIGVPFLGKLPLIGPLFSRTTTDIEKIDLLIFITARIIEPGTLTLEEMERLRKRYEEFLRQKLSLDEPKRKSSMLRRKVRQPEPSSPSASQGNRGILYQRE